MSVRIPPDSEKSSLVRIEGDPQGVRQAKRELLDLASRMVRPAALLGRPAASLSLACAVLGVDGTGSAGLRRGRGGVEPSSASARPWSPRRLSTGRRRCDRLSRMLRTHPGGPVRPRGRVTAASYSGGDGEVCGGPCSPVPGGSTPESQQRVSTGAA